MKKQRECENCGGQGVDPTDDGNGMILCTICGGSGVYSEEYAREEIEELIKNMFRSGVRLKFKSGQYGWTDYKIQQGEYVIVIDDEENLKVNRRSSGERIAGYNPERAILNWYGNSDDVKNLKTILIRMLLL